MSNETAVTETGGAPPALAKLAAKDSALLNPEARAAAQEQAGKMLANREADGSVPILKVNQGDGSWSYGQRGDKVREGDVFAVPLSELKVGWICWKGGRPLDQKMTPILEGQPVPEATLPDHGPYKGQMEGWFSGFEAQMVLLPDGIVLRYSANSLGARRFGEALVDIVSTQLASGAQEIVPVIRLTSNSYFNRNYNKDIVNPDFDLVGWMNPATGELTKVGEIVGVGDAAADLL